MYKDKLFFKLAYVIYNIYFNRSLILLTLYYINYIFVYMIKN